ncbi:unnamed protein product [Pseudo-nitzschia multistriata]|uniref:Nucleotide-diphospho-sugar transferase domain-containing protein n=1 Tax=Pseudo-nitzschia multistriata TaxID=183589 RepID=A0A448ZNE1_9STRA|nr:unnamed protein product [Pseudo-nitzschia multistriata]
MQVRRKPPSRRLAALALRSLVLGCLAVVSIVYLVGLATVVSEHQQQQLLQQPHPPPPPKEDGPGAGGRRPTGMPPPSTVGFAVTITGCGSDPITEGAAILKHSVHLASAQGPLGGSYGYKMYAIYHPGARACAETLEGLGYELVERETPVAVANIEGDFLRSRIEANGCCGEKELVKLEAYTLTDHPIVVHLDLDTLVLRPLDPLFDWMMAGDKARDFDKSGVALQWPDAEVPEQINAFFTRDFNMCSPHKQIKPVQGGFLVLRPDMKVYNDFVEIIRKGHFTEGGGWGGQTGVFYGSMTFQGILPYYYDVLHPGQHVEANHCVYNQMADNPRNKRTVHDVVHGICMTGEDDCEDCRSRPLEEVATSHFTLCQKPWLCLPQDDDVIQQRLCRKLHHEWHRIRSDLERTWGRDAYGPGTYQTDHFYGHCDSHGKKGYLPIERPYGPAP